jgi:hypothetical protein
LNFLATRCNASWEIISNETFFAKSILALSMQAMVSCHENSFIKRDSVNPICNKQHLLTIVVLFLDLASAR